MIANWVPLIPVAVFALWAIDHYWPRTPEQEYDRLRERLQRDMEARGLNREDQEHELMFRHAMAELRHDATEAVKKQPHQYVKIVADLAGAKARDLAMSSRYTSYRFMRVVKASPIEDILYPDALKLVDKYLRRVTKHAPTDKHLAALRTHR